MKNLGVLISVVMLFLLSCTNTTETENDKKDYEKIFYSNTKIIDVEKNSVKLGFIKLTDMAPLAIALELDYFLQEGLFVTLEAQANWKVLLDRVISGELDGAHMLAGQAIASSIGYGVQSEIQTTMSLDLNGNAISVSNEVWELMKPSLKKDDSGKVIHPISASALLPIIDKFKAENKPFNFGMVFPVSSHNYELRYWLAAGGINPGFYSAENTNGQIDAHVLLSVTPPPQMPSTMQAGTINGFCVGEPWNQQVVAKNIGVPVITDYEIWKNNPEKVLGFSKEYIDKYPKTVLAITKAVIKACKWLDDPKNRMQSVEILSRSMYVGADVEVLKKSMTGTYEYEKGDTRSLPDFNVFFKYNATYPFYSDGIWYLTQMRRWGQITETKTNDWYHTAISKVYRPDVWKKAAEMLVAEGYLSKEDIPITDGYKMPTADFIDNKMYNGKDPVDYLSSFTIGYK